MLNSFYVNLGFPSQPDDMFLPDVYGNQQIDRPPLGFLAPGFPVSCHIEATFQRWWEGLKIIIAVEFLITS